MDNLNTPINNFTSEDVQGILDQHIQMHSSLTPGRKSIFENRLLRLVKRQISNWLYDY